MKNYLVFWSLFISVIASKSEPDIKGLSREPENGLVQLGQTMNCLLNGQKPEDLQWFTISKEGEKNSIEESDVKATKEDVTYRCEVDDENYAEFKVDKDQLQPGLEFRVEPFGKSLYVVEQEDLKIECVIVKQNASELDIAKEVEIKWYEYEEQGDDTTYLPTLGNCSEENNLQSSLHWKEVVIDTAKGEPPINILDGTLETGPNAITMDNKILKIEDANRTEHRKAFKCVAYLIQNRSNCSEAAFFVRVRDKYAALWPFLGIVAEVIVICLVIFICERRRAANAKEDDDDEDEGENGKRVK